MIKSAIILCGGKATRMGNLCKKTPKALMQVGNMTILQHQATLLKRHGVSRMILAVGHLMNEIKNIVGDSLLGVDVIYSEEEKSLGTAGAISNAFKHTDINEDVFVLNGDVFIPNFSLNNLILLKSSNIMIAATEWTPPYGIIERKNGVDYGNIDKFLEKKPVLINAGLYLIEASAKPLFPSIGSVEKDVFEKNKCGYCVHHGTWFDLGTPKDLERANELYGDK